MIAYVALSVIVALLWHWRLSKFWIATVGASLSSPLIFQVLAYFHLGHLDPLFLIALAIQLGISFIAAVIIGYIWTKLSNPKNGTESVSE